MSRPQRQPHRVWDVAGQRIPIRSCAVCRVRKPQMLLLRIVTTANGLEIDCKNRLQGRGSYICADVQCRTLKALKRLVRVDTEPFFKRLEHHFDTVQYKN